MPGWGLHNVTTEFEWFRYAQWRTNSNGVPRFTLTVSPNGSNGWPPALRLNHGSTTVVVTAWPSLS